MKIIVSITLAVLLIICGCEKKDPLEYARKYRSDVIAEVPPKSMPKDTEEIALLTVIHLDLEKNYEYLLEQYREIFETYDELGGLADGYSETWYYTFYDVWDKHKGEIYDDNDNYMGGRCFDMIDGHIECSEDARDYAKYLNICFEEIEHTDELLSNLASSMSEFGGDKSYAEYLTEDIIYIKDQLEEIRQRMSNTADIRNWIYED